MSLLPDALPALQAKDAIRATLQAALQTIDENPTLLQRDHFHRMWDDVMQNVLKNLQEIRDDNTALRRALDASCQTGEDTITRGFAEIKAQLVEINTQLASIRATLADPKKKKGGIFG